MDWLIMGIGAGIVLLLANIIYACLLEHHFDGVKIATFLLLLAVSAPMFYISVFYTRLLQQYSQYTMSFVFFIFSFFCAACILIAMMYSFWYALLPQHPEMRHYEYLFEDYGMR